MVLSVVRKFFFRVVICAVLGLMFYWVFILNFDTPFYDFRKC